MEDSSEYSIDIHDYGHLSGQWISSSGMDQSRPQRIAWSDCPRTIKGVTLSNDRLTVNIIEYGARVTRVCFDGVEVALGLPDLASYIADDACLGGVIGRNAGRIAHAHCTIDGVDYGLAHNDGDNNNHSGPHGFQTLPWTLTETNSEGRQCREQDRDQRTDHATCPASEGRQCREQGHDHTADASARFELTSPDMSQGLPGTLDASVCYSIKGSSLLIDMSAESDKTTVCNMTSHIYWNLDGDRRTVLDYVLTVDSDYYFDSDDEFLPISRQPVKGTHFDLTGGHHRPLWNALGFAGHDDHPDLSRLTPDDLTDPRLRVSRGYNHAFDFTDAHRRHPDRMISQAIIESPASGLRMRLSSTAPSLLVYTAGFFGQDPDDPFGPFAGLALEPGFVPNSINETFGGMIDNPLLEPGNRYHLAIRYDFSHLTQA